ncbi:MAG: CYTH domain-containing protein [Nitrospirae bacterium]|nr:CYTH domain-containing protein [Nitrospirota bacterium]
MLVLNKSAQHHNSEGVWEPITKFKVRAGNDVSKLLEVIAELNLYLPDDWRMTRSKNNFSILVIPSSGPSYLLVGASYLTNETDMIHIIDSVFKPHFFDKHDVKAAGIKDKTKIDRSVRKCFPEIITPNLYFFQTCPDDSVSPLFARLYEKIKHGAKGKPVGRQYHRIHPIHKWGLDLDHFKWIRWEINGNVAYVDYPEEGYHGKDYWGIPLLESEPHRGRKEDYTELFDELLREYDVTKPLPPVPVTIPYEHEFKLSVPQNILSVSQISGQIKEILKEIGLTITGKSKEQVDTYFDDADLCLFKHGVSFRFRETEGKVARVTLKARPSHAVSEDRLKGEYRRIEEEITISKSQKDALFRGERITVLPYKLIPYVAPDCHNLKPVVTVKNRRELLDIKNGKHQHAEVCIDVVHYEQNGKIDGPDIEIEIESKGMPIVDVSGISETIKNELNLEVSKGSKYEREVRYMNMSKKKYRRNLVLRIKNILPTNSAGNEDTCLAYVHQRGLC